MAKSTKKKTLAATALRLHIATEHESIAKFAAATSFNPRTVRSWCSGVIPRADTANRLARLTNGAVRVEFWGEPE